MYGTACGTSTSRPDPFHKSDSSGVLTRHLAAFELAVEVAEVGKQTKQSGGRLSPQAGRVEVGEERDTEAVGEEDNSRRRSRSRKPSAGSRQSSSHRPLPLPLSLTYSHILSHSHTHIGALPRLHGTAHRHLQPSVDDQQSDHQTDEHRAAGTESGRETETERGMDERYEITAIGRGGIAVAVLVPTVRVSDIVVVVVEQSVNLLAVRSETALVVVGKNIGVLIQSRTTVSK